MRVMRAVRAVGTWVDHRLQVGAAIHAAATHPVPRRTASWAYVFGSASLVLLTLQVVTGICLALVYVPSASEAYASLLVLNFQQPLGWFLRAMHGWGSNFMVAIVLLHMVQVLLFGAYKYPRELTWLAGVGLLLMTLGMAFTGQILRWDQDAYWGLGIGASVMGRVPLVGLQLVQILLGGPIIAGETLTRFFALHVFVIPGVLIALVGVHLLMVINLGVNEWPMPGRVVKRDTYLKEYHELVQKDGLPFVPVAFQKDVVFAGLISLAVIFCSVWYGPFGPTGAPDPTIIETVPRPDFFFLWLFAALALMPPHMETFALLVGPVIGIALLLALPFFAGEGEKSWRRRPVAVFTILIAGVSLAVFTSLARSAPFSPVMEAWSGAPVPDQFLKGQTALTRQGAAVFQVKQCRNCHALGLEGGTRGPALDEVAVRLTRDQLIRQVIQGGGNMPAYGKNLNPAEVDSLVTFLETLHPPHIAPARDSKEPAVPTVTPRSSAPSP